MVATIGLCQVDAGDRWCFGAINGREILIDVT
jgi:hypothetical protein